MPEIRSHIPEGVKNAVSHPIDTSQKALTAVRRAHVGQRVRKAALPLVLAGGFSVGAFKTFESASDDWHTSDVAARQLHGLPLYAQHGIDESIGNLDAAIDSLRVPSKKIVPDNNGGHSVTSPYANGKDARNFMASAAADFDSNSTIEKDIFSAKDTIPDDSVIRVYDGQFVQDATLDQQKAHIATIINEIKPLANSPEVIEANTLKGIKKVDIIGQFLRM